MDHQHYCDHAGHYWSCSGFAARPLAGHHTATKCFCPLHAVPMAYGDHSGCPIELLVCPLHLQDQLKAFGRGTSMIPL